MMFQKLITLTERLEDPKNPLLGPTLKGLYLFGLWQTGGKIQTICYNVFHCSTVVFVVSQFTDLYLVRNDITKVLNNISLTALSVVCVVKCFSYVLRQAKWKELVKEISQEELLQIKKQDEVTMKLMAKYTEYTRVITYMYWMMVFFTNALLLTTPLIKYLSSKKYREEIKGGSEPPHIMNSWLPLNTSEMPGYLIEIVVHVIMGCQGAAVVAVYDMNAISIMSYLKGQLLILKAKCKGIFDDGSRVDVLNRIKECHRHHTVLLKHYRLFNSLLSPTMFVYVLICSITICCSVIQFSSKEATPSQRIWVIQYTTSQVAQLFLYCWHSNEITTEVYTLHIKLVFKLDLYRRLRTNQ
ncbi:hypothetical protein O3G_MSEX003954 [Manduca sexta]|uniref:Odorant receptor n=1 Tax=Manduca sexta TaxID=7130 RepID=A0A921YT94_MANSE|nr:hypothetical protein O3G_MSEX003954 [Manduca sexta]KAG6445501.1 hypothetical protein O3G_MSEX003954 [Manduca sexta]